MEKENVVKDKSYRFTIRIVKLYKYLIGQKAYVLSKQLLRCGTSIGANIAEANGAVSRADFSYKISIAYKECLETKYWLTLLKDTGFVSDKQYVSIFENADEIGRLLFSILKTTRINNQ